MNDPYSKLHSLYSGFQQVQESVILNDGLPVENCPQKSGLVFGLQVDQFRPCNYVNPLIIFGGNFHNPFNDSRFKKVPVRVIYPQVFEQSEPLGLSHKPGAYQEADQNIRIVTSQPEIRIDRVWSMAGECSNPLAAGNELDVAASAAGSGEPLSHGKGYRRAYDRTYRMSEKGKANKRAWARSEKAKAYQRAYAKSEKGKAVRKAYAKSEKGKAVRKAYRSSKKGIATQKAYQRVYIQSEQAKSCNFAYQKAYYEVFKKTGDREQARIAGRQASELIRESNKTKNNALR
ncbi:hypothetical protein [Endozoicomonas sp. GU-1]|uniref:hypothetical protein n=1 Tax=Endozoicomonas sp. GU-1 TaxID=3009078 RepID=UPI0022B51365|nr:hypothetical protein [Endozoicomonas sp. GU-1]WBA81994.1 hypothetical protein O2T12_02160 [Endozoicomonas sp. GU-1]WBA84942.1 hypothetical protein O3276_16925 [Endozoicomonas sp. GU-1]